MEPLDTYNSVLAVMSVALLSIVAGMGKRRLEWKPRPPREWRRRRPRGHESEDA